MPENPTPAPAATPTAPPTPAPAAPAAPPAAEPQVDPLAGSSSDAFDKLFSDADDGVPAAPATPPAPATPAKPAAAPVRTPPPSRPAAAKPGEKPPAATPTEFDEVEGVQVPRFKTDRDFRGWGLNGYKKAKALETELTEIRNKYSETEQLIPKTKAEAQALQSKLADIEKKYQEASQTLTYVNFEKSPEFNEKYEQPYQNAWTRALSDMKELTVTEIDPNGPADEMGNQPMRERAATRDDFESIYHAPLGQATKLANQKFGHAASIVLDHRQKIRELAKNAIDAVTKWKETSATRQKEEENNRTLHDAKVAELWEKFNAKTYDDPRGKEWWGEVPEDKEVNEEISKGFAYADQRFSKEFYSKPVEEQIAIDAQIRHRVAGFFKLRVLLKRATERAEKAEADLKARLGSRPGPPDGGEAGAEGGAPTESEGAAAEFDKRF